MKAGVQLVELLDADVFVAQADVAMYEAKCERESNAVLYAPAAFESPAESRRVG